MALRWRPLKKCVFLSPVCFVFGIVEASHPPDNMEWQYWNEFVVVLDLALRWQRESAIEQNLADGSWSRDEDKTLGAKRLPVSRQKGR